MLMRFAKVVWWLGAVFLLAAVGLQIAMQPARPKVDPAGAFCVLAFALDSQRSSTAAATSTASSALSQVDEASQREALVECRAASIPGAVSIWNRAIGLVALGIPGLALWALAFVLAGSFWRPPSTRAGSGASLVA